MASAEGKSSTRVFEFEGPGSFRLVTSKVKTVFVLITKWRPVGGNQFSHHARGNNSQQNEKGGHSTHLKSSSDTMANLGGFRARFPRLVSRVEGVRGNNEAPKAKRAR